MNDIDTERARRSVSLTWYGQAGFRLTAGDSRVLIDPFLNETEAAWLCRQVDPSYVIPMHYECIAGNTGNPGHFTTLLRESDTRPAILHGCLVHAALTT